MILVKIFYWVKIIKNDIYMFKLFIKINLYLLKLKIIFSKIIVYLLKLYIPYIHEYLRYVFTSSNLT